MMHDEIRDLARFVRTYRNRRVPSSLTWDVDGIEAALRRVPAEVDPADIAAAATRAAEKPENRTPAVIPLPGPHWQPTRSPTAPRPVHGPICGICGQYREICEAHPMPDHTFRTVEEHAATVRASKGRP